MPNTAQFTACNNCAKSKRRCDRQVPLCSRCLQTRKSCTYPPSNPKSNLTSRGSLSSQWRKTNADAQSGRLADPSCCTVEMLLTDNDQWRLAYPSMDDDLAAPSILTPESLTTSSNQTDWYLAPETWKIIFRCDSSLAMPVGTTGLKRYVARFRSWLEDWIKFGSNPFIHRRLYMANNPTCVQVAYATLASYTHRIPTNTENLLQIVEDRSTDLLRDNGAVLKRSFPEEWADEHGDGEAPDLFTQLARLHALLVYQVIGLFDGDIRARHVAEGHMPVLRSWTRKLLQTSVKAFCDYSINNDYTHALAGHLPVPTTQTQQKWYLWIFSECIRRTYLIAVSLPQIYLALQQCWGACPGGIPYTDQSGLWDATTAVEWEQRCFEKNVGLVQLFEHARDLDNVQPKDVDEFGLAMLDITRNEEVLELWKRKGRP